MGCVTVFVKRRTKSSGTEMRRRKRLRHHQSFQRGAQSGDDLDVEGVGEARLEILYLSSAAPQAHDDLLPGEAGAKALA